MARRKERGERKGEKPRARPTSAGGQNPEGHGNRRAVLKDVCDDGHTSRAYRAVDGQQARAPQWPCLTRVESPHRLVRWR